MHNDARGVSAIGQRGESLGAYGRFADHPIAGLLTERFRLNLIRTTTVITAIVL